MSETSTAPCAAGSRARCSSAGTARAFEVRGLALVRGRLQGRGSQIRQALRVLPAKRPKQRRAPCFRERHRRASYATILEHEGKQTASLGMLSLGGVSVPHARNGAPKLPLALAQHLDDRPYIASLALHLDNDEAGRRAAREIARAAASRGVAASMEPPPEGKDVNEFLLARRSRGRAPDRGR